MFWKTLSKICTFLQNAFWYVIYKNYRYKYSIADTFNFNGSGIVLYGDGEISLGADSYLGSLSSIQAHTGSRVIIGSKCAISHNVRMYTSTNLADSDFRMPPIPIITGNIIIGDAVWIGTNVFIGPNISIGDNSVVGANSVVTKSIPASEIWGGVPAKRLRIKQGPKQSE